MVVAILLFSIVLTQITENIIVRKLPKYEFEETDIKEKSEK